MKARVKATGEIVNVYNWGNPTYRATDGSLYEKDVLDFDVEDENNPDYWERLKHQYAGMAMQGMIRTVGHDRMYPPEKIAIYAIACATALVEKMKEERK